MQSPQYVYYLAICIMAITEAVLRARGREAFGRMAWVLVAAFAASFTAYQIGSALGFDLRAANSTYMPKAQIGIHALGFIVGLAISRHLPGHLSAATFLPMVTIDLARIVGLVSAADWWWAIYYLALVQFLTLAVGADLHPLGRWVRAWAARITDHLEYRGLAFWRGVWT
jgi:hypothetical protein